MPGEGRAGAEGRTGRQRNAGPTGPCHDSVPCRDTHVCHAQVVVRIKAAHGPREPQRPPWRLVLGSTPISQGCQGLYLTPLSTWRWLSVSQDTFPHEEVSTASSAGSSDASVCERVWV